MIERKKVMSNKSRHDDFDTSDLLAVGFICLAAAIAGVVFFLRLTDGGMY